VASHPDVIARLTRRWVNLVSERMAPVGESLDDSVDTRRHDIRET
jgi:hypothetical protein